MIRDRDRTLDIAKGILIVLVVLGHSGYVHSNFIYWFHMPAFFIISGILYKENSIKLSRLAMTLFIPFLTYIILNVLIRYFTTPGFSGLGDITMLLEKHIYNGKMIGGVYWYITVFFLTKIGYDLAQKYLNKYVWIIMSLSYVLAHIISINYIPDINNYTNTNLTLVLPWDLDVVLIAVWYFYIGVLLRKHIRLWYSNYKTLIITFLLCMIFILFNIVFDYNYYFDMKYSYYKSIFLDALVPVLFLMFILSVSYILANTKKHFGLAYCGEKSLYIMFLHIPICANILHIETPLIYTVIGTLIPILIAWFIEKNRYSTFLFTGRVQRLSEHTARG